MAIIRSCAALLSLLVVEMAHAQGPFDKDNSQIFFGGLVAGANFAQIDGDGFSGYHKPGFVGGGVVYLKPKSLLGFSLGLNYAQKGCKENSPASTSIGTAIFRYRVQLNYVQVPLLIHLFRPGRLHYSAGVAYNRLISSQESSEDINAIPISANLYPFEKKEWSGIVGFSYRVVENLFLCGQYEYSLSSIRNGTNIPPGYNTGTGHEYNNLMTLRLMYLIDRK
ncbi:MAG: PorT family protein [Bacteroidetes bacterium]|nr:PorT family protein [Bacteroidota bacterium]